MNLQLVFLLLSSFCCYANGTRRDEVCVPPKIVYPRTAEILYKQNKQFTVQCIAKGIPAPSYDWKRNGITVGNSSPYLRADSISGVLRFSDFDETMEGEYVCHASNFFMGQRGQTTKATSLSAPIVIRKIRFESNPTDLSTTKKLYGKEYEYIRVPCDRSRITAVAESIEYNWYYGSNVQQISSDNGRLYIDRQGTLHITYLKQSDSNFALLRCGLRSATSYTMILGPVHALLVSQADHSTGVSPQLKHTSHNTMAEVDQAAILECVFSGYDPSQPLPTITWTLDVGTRILNSPKYSVSADGRTLTIRGLNEQDDRNYYCKGKNTIGESSPQEVYLNVTSKPIFLQNKQPIDITVTEGKDAVIPCEARSAYGENPPGPVIWYINGMPNGTSTDRSKYDIRTDSLTTKSLRKPDDIMCVQCVVANSVGQIMKESCVNVILPITLTKPVRTEQVIGKGDTIDLTVSATTDVSQALTYRWRHFMNENATLGEDPKFTWFDPITMEAYINTTDMSDEVFESLSGLYRANISHSADFLVVDIRVSLKYNPAPEG